MDRTITINGIGNVKIKPDYVKIYLELTAESPIYSDALILGNKQIQDLKKALLSVHINEDDIKTESFDVSAENKYIEKYNELTREKTSKRVFSHYECSQSIVIGIDFDNQVLNNVLNAITKSVSNPVINFNFTIKDEHAIKDELLIKATSDALKKAKLFCMASNVKLGKLLKIDYSWGTLNIVSKTRYKRSDIYESERFMSANISFNPMDIETDDTATFVWEIE